MVGCGECKSLSVPLDKFFCMVEKRELTIRYNAYPDWSRLSVPDQDLIEKARQAAENSYSPYSKFAVGAAVLLANGEIITGANQENAAYPSGLCAERVALFYANAQYPEVSVKAIAVAAYNQNGMLIDPVPPCGACRQVMSETENRYNQPIRVFLPGEHEVLEFDSVADLLPFGFKPSYLTA